jgi:hypothetical protein
VNPLGPAEVVDVERCAYSLQVVRVDSAKALRKLCVDTSRRARLKVRMRLVWIELAYRGARGAS